MTLLEDIARAMANADKWHANSPESHRPVAFIHEEYRDLARAALAAIEASGTHVIVPTVPTDQMIGKATGALTGPEMPPDDDYADDAKLIYAAMLSARPKVT